VNHEEHEGHEEKMFLQIEISHDSSIAYGFLINWYNRGAAAFKLFMSFMVGKLFYYISGDVIMETAFKACLRCNRW